MISEKAYAKLNLVLDIVGKRTDGYHDLKSIMVPLELHDTLSFETCESLIVECDMDIKNNVVEKAAILFLEKYNIKSGVKIVIEKKIPIGGGLAGGSSNASATLRGLNRFFHVNVELKELEELANKLGSDTLFCLYNRSAYVYGRGDHIEFLDYFDLGNVTLICPNFGVSTKEIFKNFIKKANHSFEALLELYKRGERTEFIKQSYNDLLGTSLSTYKELDRLYCVLKKDIDNLKMTGSGSTLYYFGEKKRDIIGKNVKVIETMLKQ